MKWRHTFVVPAVMAMGFAAWALTSESRCSREPTAFALSLPPSLRELGADLASTGDSVLAGRRLAITVEDTGRALHRLTQDAPDLLLSRRPLRARELENALAAGATLPLELVAHDGIAVHVHRDNPIRALPQGALRDLLQGDRTAPRWSDLDVDLGPAFDEIRVAVGPHLARDLGRLAEGVLAGRTIDRARVTALDDCKTVQDFCAEHQNGIAFTTLDCAPTRERPLEVTGEDGGKIALRRPVYALARGAPAVELVRWLGSAPGRRLLRSHGLEPTEP
ncbi:MAG: substrate-binding domain-containing protein [Planctomycetes bacterium]|nr:substrate-binding domain-containing protein [Planctomycetota bacterium]